MAEENTIEPRSFGFDKATTKVASISFRLDKEHKDRLESQFAILKVSPRKDRISDKMTMYIDKIDALLKKPLVKEKDNEVIISPRVLTPIEQNQALQEPKIVQETSNLGDVVKGEGQRYQYQDTEGAETEQEYSVRVKEESAKATHDMSKSLEPPQSGPKVYPLGCLRDLKLADPRQWWYHCSLCKARYPSDYSKCQCPDAMPYKTKHGDLR